MGTLSDIHVSSDDEEALGYDGKPSAFADRAQWKGFTPVEGGILWGQLRNLEWTVAMADEFLFLPLPDDHDSFITRVPAAMTEILARLTPEQISVAATKFAPEMELAYWTLADVQSFLKDLGRLAQIASATGRNVYVWNSV